MRHFMMLSLLISALSSMLAQAQSVDPMLNQPAPDFHLVDQLGMPHDLHDFHGQWLVLYFYPKDHTPGCTQEAEGFRDLYPLFKSHHVQIIGISVNTQSSHADFAHALQIPFPLLADVHGDSARRYGVLHQLIITSYAARQTFLIDPAGVIRRHYVHVDPAAHPAQALRDVVTLQSKLP